jgi:DNA-binding phage protein
MMLETLPFDPADYLDSEEGLEAYLADARLDGAEAVADAVEVVARARARMAEREPPRDFAPPERNRRAS